MDGIEVRVGSSKLSFCPMYGCQPKHRYSTCETSVEGVKCNGSIPVEKNVVVNLDVFCV